MYCYIKTGFSTVFVLILLTVFQPQVTCACSVFCIDKGDNLVIGRNYDWGFGEGMLVVNKRNQTKKALCYWGEPKHKPARWTSKYGSITFVQYGREIAFGGMNEAGLAVNELWLDETVYPRADKRPSLSVDQYIQYLLDNYQSVGEIAADIERIRLRPVTDDFTKIHFFAVDPSGQSIVIEFLGGKAVVYTKETMPVKALTNNTYENSISFHQAEPQTPLTSLGRFARAAQWISRYEPGNSKPAVSYAFDLLDMVDQGPFTKFKIAFDLKNKIIYFKSLSNPQLRHVKLDCFDFAPQTNSLILDLNKDGAGDVSNQFINYSTEYNENLIERAWRNLGYTDIYPKALQLISRYPETFICN